MSQPASAIEGLGAHAEDDDLIRRFLASPKQRRLHPGSVRARKASLRRLSRHLAGRGLTSATTAEIAAWLDQPWTPTTRTTHLVYAHAFYGWAHEEAMVATVPTVPLRAPRRSLEDSLRVDAKGLSRQRATLDQLVRAYLGERMRRGELSALSARNMRCTLEAVARYYGDGPARHLSSTDLNGWAETIGHLAPGDPAGSDLGGEGLHGLDGAPRVPQHRPGRRAGAGPPAPVPAAPD